MHLQTKQSATPRLGAKRKDFPMGKKKRILLNYRRLGKITKKLEKKFASFIEANKSLFGLDTSSDLKETAQETDETTSEIQEEPPKKKTTTRRSPVKKKTSTTTTKKTTTRTRKTKATKTKQEA